MKKIIWLLFLLMIPFGIKAYGISDYKINATVLDNGDLLVQEVFNMVGEYNGFERIIDYKNSNTKSFDGSEDSFNGSDIYNGTGIELKQIRAIPTISNDFSSMQNSGDIFKKVSVANKGDYGVYVENQLEDSVKYLIYNPSTSGKVFYIEYVINALAIVHNDISEIGWNIFTSLTEDVENLEVIVNIPNNQNELRVWAHGPLTGNIDIKNNQQFVLNLTGLYANEAIDSRFVFDKNSIINPTKTTDLDALDTIIKLETEKADKANQEREALQKEQTLKRNISFAITIIYLSVLAFLVIRFYFKYDREIKTDFNNKYFRDIPRDCLPTNVGYLFNKKIRPNDLSASILKLIDDKIISVEGNDKKNYKFIYQDKSANISDADQKLIKFIFEDKEEILLEDMKKNAKKNHTVFLTNYNTWLNLVTSLAKKEDFYVERPIRWYILFCILGFAIGSIAKNSYWMITIMILSIAALIYFISSNKRTQKGSEEYAKWKALKKFMEDFSIIDSRELPEVKLWGKYLVYAVSLGCADKLAKDMEIRVKEFDNVYNNVNFDTTDIIRLTAFNHIISNSINSAISSARTAENIANSASSSGSGSGGGFSVGGGSFGGGGGGGRF